EHKEAIQMLAAEQYLVGKLTDAERDQFEEHFFDCPECGEDVRWGAIFAANARAVLGHQSRYPDVGLSWWEWVRLRPAFTGPLAGVVVLLAGAFVYKAVVTSQLRGQLAELRVPQSYPSFFLRNTTRGAEQVIEVPRASRFLALSLDLTPGQIFSRYLGEVSGESDAILFSIPLDMPKMPGESLNVLMSASSLEPGRRYKLVIRGLDERATVGKKTEIASYYFIFQQH